MIVLTTNRLTLRRLEPDDAELILAILTDPSFVRFVGDRGVRTVADARAYLEQGAIASYARHGFGLYLVARTQDDVPLGICGLVQRDWLPDADVGYAFLPAHRGNGYALEAVQGVIEHARRDCALTRLLAIIAPANRASIAVAERAGMRFESEVERGGVRSAIYAIGTPPAFGQ